MQRPVQITARGFDLPPAHHTLIEESTQKLEQFYPALVGCIVSLSIPAKSAQGKPVHYNVRIHLEVPGKDVVVTRQRQADLRTAIQEAFHTAGRKLQDFSRRQRDLEPV